MSTLNRDGKKKRELRNLVKRGNVWYFKKMVGGKIKPVSLNTGDLELAKARRNKLANLAYKEKWESIDGLGSKRTVATLGQVIEKYDNATNLQLDPDTVRNNIWALRHLVRQAKEIKDVDDLACSVLDRPLVGLWQQRCLKAAGTDKIKLDAAAVSANSVFRQARSVFGKRPTRHNIYNGLVLPDLTKFKTAPMLDELKRDSYNKPDEELLRKIWQEAYKLRDGDPEAVKAGKPDPKNPALWLIFYLASQSGLRKSELKFIRYRWFMPGIIRTCFETDFTPKGKRERDVPVVAAVEQECRRVALENGWPTGPTDCLLQGTATEKEDLFKAFGPWMEAQGWTRRQKAHELRKIFASDLTESSDPYDTQQALGHQDIKTTMRYAARRKIEPVNQAERYAGPTIVQTSEPTQAAA